jgi:hypothetical protein
MTSSDASTVREAPGASGGWRRARRRAPGEAALAPLLRRCRPPFGTAPGVLASSGRVSSRSTSSGQARPSGSGRRTRRSGWSERGCTPRLPRCSTPGDAGSTAPDPSSGAAIRDVGHGCVLEHVAASARSAPSPEGTNTSPRSRVESLRVARTRPAPLGPPPSGTHCTTARASGVRGAPVRDPRCYDSVCARPRPPFPTMCPWTTAGFTRRSGGGCTRERRRTKWCWFLLASWAGLRASEAVWRKPTDAPHRPAARSVPHCLAAHPPGEPQVSGVGPDAPSFREHEARIDAFFFISFPALFLQALQALWQGAAGASVLVRSITAAALIASV